MTIVNAADCFINTTCYSNCNNITSIDLKNTPWVNNNMETSFAYCNNLTSVININDDVTNMCGTFGYCTNMVNAPIIPNSVTNMESTFYSCTNLVNAPVIPNSVTNIDNIFEGCTNLRGDIIIQSTNIQYCLGSFMNCDTYNKYVWIKPNTTTWNSFISDGGYDTNGTQNKVFMREWDGTFSNLIINVTPNTATVNIVDVNDSSTTYYAWKRDYDDARYYTLSETPSSGDQLYEKINGSIVETTEYVGLNQYDSSTTPPRVKIYDLADSDWFYRDASNDETI